MKVLVLIPSYNDLPLVVERIEEIEDRIGDFVGEYLVVDESDEESSLRYLQRLKGMDRVRVIHRERRLGKWSIWPTAFNYMLSSGFDALIEVDADVFIEHPQKIIQTISNGFDVVTCYSHYLTDKSPLSFMVTRLYSLMHDMSRQYRLYAMGGECIALSRRAVEEFKKHNLFYDPFPLDDYVISLAGAVLGLKCTSVDCGLTLKLPSTIRDWMTYRLRHTWRALELAHSYLRRRLGRNYLEKLNRLINKHEQARRFIIAKCLIKSSFTIAPIVVLQYLLSKVPLEIVSPIVWPRLRSEKMTKTLEVE